MNYTNFDKYNILHNEVIDKLQNGEITIEKAKEINDLAFDKYITSFFTYESALLIESFNDEEYGDDFYFESSNIIKNIKAKFNKDDNNDKSKKEEKEKVNKSAVRKAFKAYVKYKTTDMSIEWYSKNDKFKKSDKYKKLKKKLDEAKKEYDDLKKDFNNSEKASLNKLVDYFDKSFNKSWNIAISGGNNSLSQQQLIAQQMHQQAIDDHLRFMDTVNRNQQQQFIQQQQQIMHQNMMHHNMMF